MLYVCFVFVAVSTRGIKLKLSPNQLWNRIHKRDQDQVELKSAQTLY